MHAQPWHNHGTTMAQPWLYGAASLKCSPVCLASSVCMLHPSPVSVAAQPV